MTIAGIKERLKKMANPSRKTARIVMIALGVLALAWQHIQATRLGYRVESARRRVHALQGRIGTLELELHSGLSPAQLAQHARARLGMQPASPEALRLLGAGPEAGPSDSFLARLLARLSRSLTSGLPT